MKVPYIMAFCWQGIGATKMAQVLYSEALARLSALIEDGWSRGLLEPNLASLATADTAARPSVRMVNVLSTQEEGLLFLANINSGKIRQITLNPRAGMCFYWPLLQEQVIVEGRVARAEEAVSDIYWKKIPREKQVYNSVDKDNLALKKPGELKARVTEQWSQSGFESIERPANWHAFYLEPDRIEFWPSGWRRAQERVHYSKTNEGDWCKELIGI